MRKALLLLPIALMTAACGFQPLYGGGSRSPVAQTLRSVTVSPIAEESGWLLRGALRDPSVFQWPLLEAAVEGNIVADFPICNKSFNCSYSGSDL